MDCMPIQYRLNIIRQAVSPVTYTHYVAPYASVPGATSDYDTTNGTPYASATNIATPCTLGEFLANAVAGNIAGLMSGTYVPDYTGLTDATIPAFRPAGSGLIGLNPITIKAYTGETPVINGNPALPDVPAFGATTGSHYIIWDGITGTIADTSGGYNTNYLFHFYESTYSEVRNCTFNGVVNGAGGNTALIRFERADHSKAYNNTLTGNLGGTNETNTAAVWVFGSTDVEVYQNDITNCSNGIMQKTGPNQNNLYYLNYIYAGVSGGAGGGIFLNEQFATGIAGSAYNNLVIGFAIGIWIEGVSTSNTMNDSQVYNNTIYGCTVGIYTSNFARNTDIWNNIVSECGATLRYYIGAALPATSNYNCLHHSTTWRALTWEDPFAETEYLSLANWISGVGLDTPDTIDTDPQFVNAGGTTPADYVLGAGSPCIGSGLGGINRGVLDLAQVGVQ